MRNKDGAISLASVSQADLQMEMERFGFRLGSDERPAPTKIRRVVQTLRSTDSEVKWAVASPDPFDLASNRYDEITSWNSHASSRFRILIVFNIFMSGLLLNYLLLGRVGELLSCSIYLSLGLLALSPHIRRCSVKAHRV